SHQELSAQQVCSYLLDFGDHYTSHTFNNLYWTSFERGPSQYIDYIFRGRELERLPLWDSVAQTEKVKNNAKNTMKDESKADLPIEWNNMLTDQAKERPKISFVSAHPQFESHVLHVRLVQNCSIPVPIGPCIPCRDQPKVYPRYCRLMLILFKPWRSVLDLRSHGQSWEEAFEQFREVADGQLLQVMHNTQLLHECRDSRDDH
ncbi:uncharacterized protein EDB91DRAFT_1007591, partial [Suillus paluster]|uniref:uncharacterized protein n=1 Tax=Suillus paluster TaxID=48578 RepID=UPI001B879662